MYFKLLEQTLYDLNDKQSYYFIKVNKLSKNDRKYTVAFKNTACR